MFLSKLLFVVIRRRRVNGMKTDYGVYAIIKMLGDFNGSFARILLCPNIYVRNTRPPRTLNNLPPIIIESTDIYMCMRVDVFMRFVHVFVSTRFLQTKATMSIVGSRQSARMHSKLDYCFR